MTPEQHQRVKALFTAASRLEPGTARAALLDEQCDDAEVRAEVEALLSADEDPIHSLKTPALGVNIGKTLGAALRSLGPTEMPTRLGQYRILRVLGEGGMGMVYVAEQDKPRRTVALKVIHGGPGSRTLVRRFEHEAELLGRLQHPGIAQIFEAGSAPSPQGPVPFIAMELIEGEALTKHVESKRLGTRERLELVAKVCDAVQYAHQRGVIHRDLKPANVLVDARGQPKVLDFGVARASQGDAQVTTMRTSMGQLIGTLPYMSPEQVLADPDGIDTRSDVYSLGVVLYQVLTGKLPHDLDSRSLPEAARVIREDEPIRLSTVSRVFRGEIEIIVGRALEKDRSRRYQSAADLGEDLRRYLNGEPIQARQDSALYVLTKQVKRYRGLVAAVAAAVIGLVAFSAYALWQSEKNASLADRAAREASKARAAQAEAEVQRGTAQQQQLRADLTSEEMRDQLVYSNVERGRLLAAKGDRHGAESLIWPEHLRFPEWLFTRWALRDLYAHQPLLAAVQAARSDVFSLAMCSSADGRTVAAVGERREVVVYDIETLRPIHNLLGSDAKKSWVALSPDASLLAVGDAEGEIDLWDLRSDGEPRKLCGHQSTVWGLDFSPDGTLLASASEDGTVGLWDTTTGERIRTLRGHQNGAARVSFSPDGSVLATAGFDRTILLYPALLDPPLPPLVGHTDRINRIAWSPDGNTLASGANDALVRLWDVHTLAPALDIYSPNGPVRNLSFSPDGRSLISCGWWNISVWDTRTAERVLFVTAAEGNLGAAFNHDGTEFLTLSAYGRLSKWDFAPGRAKFRIPDVAGRATIGFTPDGRMLAVTDTSGRGRFFDAQTGAFVGFIPGPERRSRTICFHPTRPWIATGTTSGRLEVWDYKASRCIAAFSGFNEPTVHGAAFSPDGKLFAATCINGEFMVLDTDSWQSVVVPPKSSGEALSVTFPPDARGVITTDRARPGIQWSLDAQVKAVYPIMGARMWTGAMDALGQRFISGDWARTVEVYNAASGIREETLIAHLGLVTDVAFMPPNADDRTGSRIIASCAADGTVRLWDVEGGWLLMTLEDFAGADMNQIAFSPDGSRLAATCRDNVTVYDLTYFDRHIAGNAEYQFQTHATAPGVSDDSMAVLRSWCDRVRARGATAAGSP